MGSGSIAFGSYKWRQHAFGILLAGEFGREANNYANQDRSICVGFVASDKPPNISMKPQLMYLPAENTNVMGEIQIQVKVEICRFIR